MTVEGSITFGAEIGCGQYAKVILGNHEIVAKGKTSAGWGCDPYDVPHPFVGDLSRASYPDVQMFTFDWQVGDGVRQPLSGDENSIRYSFSSYLRQGILPTSPPDVQVTATATATANYFLPAALFDHWHLSENNTELTCGGEMGVSMIPTDGYGEIYAPFGIWGSEAPVTVEVDSGGAYVFLRALGQEDRLVATTLADGCTLVFDPSRGGFSGDTKDVFVKVTGGGKTGTFVVTLRCDRFDHLKVTAAPNVVSEGMTSTLTVIAQDANNQELTFAEDFDVTLTLYSPDVFWSIRWGPPPFGSFVVDGGEPQLAQIVVPYSVARASRVKYFVESDILSTVARDSMAITIQAEKADDWTKSGSTEVKVKRKTCLTPIVVCSATQIQPPVFYPGSIEVVREAQGFSWFDANGQIQTALVSGCNYVNPRLLTPKAIAEVEGRLGITLPLLRVPIEGGITSYNVKSEISKPTICLDGSDPTNPRWRIVFENIRIPIFQSICQRPKFREMGGNATEWASTVTDYETFRKADEDMSWWEEGCYKHPEELPPHSYTFSSMIQAHEDIHLSERKAKYAKAFTDAYAMISGLPVPSARDFPCPEDALAQNPGPANLIRTAYIHGTYEATSSEIETDNLASEKRAQIHGEFQNWARTQSWYPR